MSGASSPCIWHLESIRRSVEHVSSCFSHLLPMEERGRAIPGCQARRPPGKQLSEVMFPKWWEILNQSLGARAPEKSEKLTTLVADLLFKLI